MYRVLAARSLKFLEQRQEDTASYQRQLKEAKDGRTRSATAARPTDHITHGEEEDAHARVKDTPAGGAFHIEYPDKSSNSNGSFVRQVGDRAVAPPPLLGYPPKPQPTSEMPAGANSTNANKQHAHIIIHEKKDKSDQLNLRIQTSMEKQKLQTYILVDDVIQNRLKKKRNKDLSISTSLAALRGIKVPTSHTVAAQKDLVGVGVWSTLGADYQQQGPPDLDLPTLNWGVPLRELTKSKQPRPAPLKESSDHRKKYEGLVELFRTQRHRVMKPHPRDGQDGVPRPQSSKLTIGGANSLAAAMNAGSSMAWDVNPLLTDISISDEASQNPANQSLLARLYQTQSQARLALMKDEKEDHGSSSSDPHGHSDMKRSHSSSAGGVRARDRSHPIEQPVTSVDRIAALQPRRVGWDASSIRPLASSASASNFERRAPALTQGQSHAVKLSHSMSLTALPETHPAQTHAALLPQTVTPAHAKQLAQDQADRDARDAKSLSIGVRLNKSASHGDIGSRSLVSPGSVGGGRDRSNVSSPTRPKFTSRHGPSTMLAADHPEYMTRKREAFTMAKERAKKKKAKEEKEKEVYEAVMKQLAESRLDHLHRWRNSFDGTKQRLDRLLIKRLVSRAEERATALDGGVATLGPAIEAVLTKQEITEATSDPAFHARTQTQARHIRNKRSYGRDAMLQDDFTNAYYDEHASLRDLDLGIAEGDEDGSLASTRSKGAPRRHPKSYSYHDLATRQEAAEREYQAQVAADPSTLPQHFYSTLEHARQMNKSGQQQQTRTNEVTLTETKPNQEHTDDTKTKTKGTDEQA